MRVALFTDTYPPEINGVATSSYNLAKTFREHGDEVLVVTTNPFTKTLSYENNVLRMPGFELKALYGYRVSSFFNSKAAKIITAFRPDIVHCQTDVGVGMFGSIMASRLGIGKIYTFHTMIEDYAYYVTRGHFDRVARHVVRFFYRGKSHSYDAFIAPSGKIKDYLRSIGIDGPIHIIPTGIDVKRFSIENKDTSAVDAIKKKWGIAPDDYVILSLGRIAKEKSIDMILNGYKKYLETNPKRNTKFVITGLGPAEDDLKALAKQLGIEDHVIFTGKCAPDETQNFYHIADCFASASITETQGLTFMEAMASSLVVLARFDDNLSGTIRDGENGFFFLSEDDLVQKLKHVVDLSDEERKAITKAGVQAAETYSMDTFYKQAHEVYSNVCRQRW
ncbi:MAG: glycosyltransferase [Bacilli bacterium]|nr:glycosyltransferase [Bacilli bacterium]